MIATVLRNVDLPDAFDPVRSTLLSVVNDVGIGSSISGWNIPSAVIFFSDVNVGSQFLPIRSLKDATAIILSRSPIVSKISLNDFSLLRNVLYMRLNLIRSR